MKATVVQQLICGECESHLINMYDADNKKYYLVCPDAASQFRGVSCSEKTKKYIIPKVSIELKPYE